MGPETSLHRAPERAYLPLRQGVSHRRPGERRPRRKVECRPRVELARALRLGHRVVRRERASPPEPTPLEALLMRSDLRDYQRELVRTVLERVDPQLDTRRRDVYVEARRRLWYADRQQVIAHMGRGRGLDEAQIEKAVRTLDGFSSEDQLKVTNWLLGDVFEDTKLWFVEGLGKGRIGGWTDPEQALHESSVLPGTFKSAFGMARAPKIEQPKNLGEVEEILDYWDLAARALPEYHAYYRQLLARFERAEDGSSRGSGLDPGSFLERLGKVRADIARSRHGLFEFGSLADSEDASEAALGSALGRGQEGLGRARDGLARLAPDAQKLLAGIAGTRQETRALLRSELEKGRPRKSWWQRCVANVTTAVGGFVKKLADPENLMAALEVGLEIAGGLVTGGASILIRIAKWLVTSGMDLKKVVGEGLAKIKSYTSLEGLKKIIPIDRLFSTEGLIGSLVGAFFGQLPTPGAGLEAKKPHAERKGPERRRKGSVVSRLLAMVDGVVSFLRSGYGQIQGFVAGQLAKIDLTQYPWFRKLIGFYARLMRLKAAAGGMVAQATGWVAKLRDQVAGFFGGVAGKVQAVLGLFANPAKEIAGWVSKVVRTGVEYLLNLLVENPPSAILKTALKVLQGIAGGRLVDLFLDKVPFAKEILGKVSSAVSGLLGGLLEAPAKEVYGWGKKLFGEQALPVIVGLRSSFESLLADGSGFLDRLTGGLWSSWKGAAGDRGMEGRIQRQPATPASPSYGPTPAAAIHPALAVAFRRTATAATRKLGRAPRMRPRPRVAVGRGELVQRTVDLEGVYEEFTKRLKGNLEKEALEYLLTKAGSGEPPVKVELGGKDKKIGGRSAWVTEGEWSGSVVKRLLKGEWTTRSKDPTKKPPRGGKAYADLVTRIHRAAKGVMSVTKVKCNVREIWILSSQDMALVEQATERAGMVGRYFRHAQLVILTLPEEVGTGRLTGELLDEDTLVHELTHGCQHQLFTRLRRRVREGIIEYFACRARKKEEPHGYEDEVRCIRSLVRRRNCEKALRKACFQGEVDSLFNIEGWAKFYRLLGHGKYGKAIEGLETGSR